MPIKIDNFSGMIPRIAKDKLPPGAAQSTVDADFRGGALRAINIGAPLHRLHDGEDTPDLNGQAPATEITPLTNITAPSTAPSRRPAGGTPAKIANVASWLTKVVMHGWATKVVLGTLTEETRTRDLTLDSATLRFSDTGFSIEGEGTNQSIYLDAGVPYTLFGPVYQVVTSADALGADGGPETAATVPLAPSRTMRPIGPMSIPLYDTGNRIYAFLELLDVDGPSWVRELTYSGSTTHTFDVPTVTLYFSLNYVEPRVRFFHFVNTAIDTTSEKREGPPSDLSELITVYPGDELQLDIENTRAGGTNIYRSDPGSDRLLFIENVASGTQAFTDTGAQPQNIVIPPSGNWEGSGVTNAGTFNATTVMHPAQFAAAHSGDGKTVWLSDLYRYHAWPPEYSIPFQDDIYALGVSGGSIIVFTRSAASPKVEGEVFALSGSNPEAMAQYHISSNHPLLGKGGLLKLGPDLYYVTYDGLAKVTGNSVQIVTKEFFTREDWAVYATGTNGEDEAKVKTYVKGDSIFISNGLNNIRLDMGEGVKTVSAWLDDNNSEPAAFSWKSGVHRFDRREIIDAIKLTADTPNDLTVTLYADGAGQPPWDGGALDSGKVKLTGFTTYAREWEIEITSSTKNPVVYEIELFERQTFIAESRLRLTPDQVTSWESFWLNMRGKEKFVCGQLVTQPKASGSDMDLDFYDSAGGPLGEVSRPADAGVFVLPRTFANQDLINVRFHSSDSGPFDATSVQELLLFTRETVAAPDGVVHVKHPGGIPDWLHQRYDFGGQKRITSILVTPKTGMTPRIDVWFDGNTGAADISQAFSSGAEEIRLGDTAPVGSIDFGFSADDDVEEVAIYTQNIQEFNGPVSINGPPFRRRFFRLPDRGSLAGIVVRSRGASTKTIDIYADNSGSTSISKTIDDLGTNFFPFAKNEGEAGLWELDVDDGDTVVDSVVLFPRERVSVPGDELKVIALDASGVPEWLTRIYDFDGHVNIQSIRVIADNYSSLKMNIFLNDATAATETMNVTDKEFRVADLDWDSTRTGNLQLDFDGDDEKVNKVIIYLEGSKVVSGPVTIPRRPWRGNLFHFADRGSFAGCFLMANTYTTMNLRLYSDGTRVGDDPLIITNGNFNYFARGLAEGSKWEVDLDAGAEPYGLTLFPVTHQAVQGRDLHLINSGSGVPPWATTIYDMPGQVEFTSGIVKVNSIDGYTDLKMLIYKDGATTASATITSIDGTEFRIEDSLGPCSTIAIAFEKSSARVDHQVDEIRLFARQVLDVPNEGIIIRDSNGKRPMRRLVLNFPDQGTFLAGRVSASDYSGSALKLDIRQGGASKQVVTVADDDEFKFSTAVTGVIAREWEIDLAHPAEVYELMLFGNVRDVVEDGVVRVRRVSDPFSWLARRIVSVSPVSFSAGRIVSDAYPVTLTLFNEGVKMATVVVEDERSFRLPRLRRERHWEYDLTAASTKLIHELALATSMEALNSG